MIDVGNVSPPDSPPLPSPLQYNQFSNTKNPIYLSLSLSLSFSHHPQMSPPYLLISQRSASPFCNGNFPILKSPLPSLFLLKFSPHLASSSLRDPLALSTMTNYISPKSPSPPLLLFLLKILPLLSSSSLRKMSALSARIILLTLSFSNSLFCHYLFSHYLFSYSIPHGLQRLPC